MGYGHGLLDNSLMGTGFNNAGKKMIFTPKEFWLKVKKFPEYRTQNIHGKLTGSHCLWYVKR